MTISLICACKDRNEPLQIALASWLLRPEITEIIIVDWSSKKPLAPLTKLDKRIKVITVQNEKYFNQPQPLNLAASIATGDCILKVDCDYIFSPYFNFFDSYHIDENSFVSGKHNIKNYEYFNGDGYVVDKDNMSLLELVEYVNSYSPIFKHLIGLLFITRQNFMKVGGYNEKLGKYYSYEDDEIFHRLRVLGLNEIKLNFDYNILHIPHSDKKRTENFEGYDSNKLDEIKNSLSVEDENQREWNAEYLLSMDHIETNKKIAPLTDEYYVPSLTKWDIQRMDEQNYYASKVMEKNKLENFPSVYYVSLEESVDRQKNLERQFSEYGIVPTPIISKRFAESDDEITGVFLDQMNGGTTGCVISHLKAIRKWYEETDEDYAFFCEDDLSLETIQYWDFTWEEFIESIPDDALCVQLLVIRKNYETFEIRKRVWDDWAGTAYIITRNYARVLVENYCLGENKFHLELPGSTNVVPLLENVLFESLDDICYTVPLFVEDVGFGSTFSSEEDKEVVDNQKRGHYEAKEKVLNYWKNKMNLFNFIEEKPKNSGMNQIETLLTKYSYDTEDAENNFDLGVWYWNQGHTAPALSYFLRCAERAVDTTLAYEALLWSHLCYEKQGTRDVTARTLLQHALHTLPNRPEAYYLLAKFHTKREQWTDAYIIANQGLTLTEKDLPSLRNDVGYAGDHGLLYEKAISAWWWGKSNESREILQDVKNNYDLTQDEYNLVIEKLNHMGVETLEKVEVKSKDFNYPENFNWSDLTFEDIITIEREVVEEKVYRFWNDVKEGDVVLDIGASVGAYTISILDQKPSKVYCVEPSKKLLKALSENCFEKTLEYQQNPLVYINHGIVDKEGDRINIFGGEKTFSGITFKKLIEDYSIDHIDYMKIDCEGGEYSIFKEENMDFLLNKVDFIAMEVHLNYGGCREKFKNLRDNYLTRFKNYKVMSCTRQNISWGESIDIKDRIFDDKFVNEYSCEFMIYISKN
jgi:FkbM family methyltransferase